MAKSFFIKDEIKWHFTYYSKLYILSIISAVVGIIIGLFISLSDYSYLSLLSSSDKQIFDYIVGSLDYSALFYSKLKDVLLYFAIIFIFDLSIFSSFLSYIYMGYQMMLIVLSSAAIISLYNFSGFLIVIFLIIPINIIIYFIMMVYNCVLSKRAISSHKYKLKFNQSFLEDLVWKYILGCISLAIIVCFLYGFVLPLFIRNLTFIVY